MLRVITYNCFNIKNSIQDICDLCNSYDLLFLQETWLLNMIHIYFLTYEAILKDLVLRL